MKKNKIINSIIDSGLISEGMVIVVGVSGGPDSLCLLHALSQLSDTMELGLVPVHVNHKLRPEADSEAENVIRICDRLGLECELFEADCAAYAKDMKMSEEEAGRSIRYGIFDEVAASVEEMSVPRDKICIAVAHNADDQSETVLFRLMRGTGAHGLSGISHMRSSEEGYLIIRPLLDVDRSDIEKYIRDNRLRPNIDSSNAKNDYTRNRIRNELIPYLEENFNPNLRRTLRRFAAAAEWDDELLSGIAASRLKNCLETDEESERMTLDISELRTEHPSILSRIFGFVIQILGQESNASFELTMKLVGLVYSENPSAGIDLPGGYRARREYDSLIIAASENEETIFPNQDIRLFPQVMMKKDYVPDEDSIYAVFDFDSFNEAYPGKAGELELRTRKEGDYLPIKGGRKKIQDFLVDAKVPRNARDSILMVAIGNEILWILPSIYFNSKRDCEKGRYSSLYSLSEATERVLYIEIADNI